MANSNQTKEHLKDDEIDVIELLYKLWKSRKLIVKITLVFFAIGLLIAFLSKKEYTANTIIVPQTSNNSKIGNLGGLAAMAGINLGGSPSEGIPTILYPKIVQSIPFQRELVQTTLNFNDIEGTITYFDYYNKYVQNGILDIIKKYTIGLPSLIINSLRENKIDDINNKTDDKDIIVISKDERSLFNLINSQLSLNINEKEGFIELSFSMPEAVPAAEMAKKAKTLLQEAITNFKIKKAKQQLEFIEQQYIEAEKEFKQKQFALAQFQDRNRGLNSSLSQTKLERLRSDYNLSYSVFSELAKQLETQKIQVKEDTPAFTTIEPVSIPLQKSKPKRLMIIAIWAFVGFIIGVAFVFTRDFIKKYKQEYSIKEE